MFDMPEERDIQQYNIAGGYNAGAGLGRRSPAILRATPRFPQVPRVVVSDTFCEVGDYAHVPALYDGDSVDGALLLVEGLPAQVGAAGLRFEAVTLNRKVGSPRGILRLSSCGCYCRAPLQDQKNCRLPILEILEMIRERRRLLLLLLLLLRLLIR